MNRAEDYRISKIDRSRGRTSNAARFAELDRMASSAVALPLESRDEAVTFLRLVVGHAFARLLGFDIRHRPAPISDGWRQGIISGRWRSPQPGQTLNGLR